MVGEGIICQHSHSKPTKNLPSDAPNLASADNAGSLAVQVEAYKSIQREVQLAHTIECAMGLPVQRQQQGNSMFSHGMRRIDRDSRHGQLQLLGVPDIDVIEPRRAKRHEFDPFACQRLQTTPVQLVIDKYADGAGVLCSEGSVVHKSELEIPPLNTMVRGCLLQCLSVVRLGVEDSSDDHRRRIRGHQRLLFAKSNEGKRCGLWNCPVGLEVLVCAISRNS